MSNLSVRLFVCQFVCVSIFCLSICLCVHLFFCQFVCVSGFNKSFSMYKYYLLPNFFPKDVHQSEQSAGRRPAICEYFKKMYSQPSSKSNQFSVTQNIVVLSLNNLPIWDKNRTIVYQVSGLLNDKETIFSQGTSE